MIHTKISFTLVFLSAMSVLTAQASINQARSSPAEQARSTLKAMEESAVDASQEADPIQSLRSDLSPDSHFDRLTALTEDINTMGREISVLKAESESLDPWEKQAIDKVEPLLRDTAANAQKAIASFNQNRTFLWRDDYRRYVNGAFEGSEQIANTLKNYLNYGKAHDQEQELKESLEVSGK